jgi:hypothetical protein
MYEPEPAPRRPRAPRWDKGQPLWTPRDLEVLAWMAEQYGVRRDHLALLLGRRAGAETQTPGRLADTTVKDWVQRWRQAGVIGSIQLLMGQPSWAWVTCLGLEHLELNYRRWEPKARGVEHLHAVNQVRLWVEARYPEAVWWSERALRSGRAFTPAHTRAEHLPDAEVELRGQRVAIEVERSPKRPRPLQAILYELARRYDAIWYFCPRATQGAMQRAVAQLNEPVRKKFSLIDLP